MSELNTHTSTCASEASASTCIDYNLLQVSGSVQVDTVDIGKSDHFLVWMELGRTIKTTKQQKRVIKKWCIERFQDEEV